MYRIIIADDEPLIIRGLKKMMEWGKMDTEVVGEAEDGEQLLNLLDTLEPDIIISDISMPEKTGLDVLKEINKRKLKTKVIFLSGFQEFSYAKEAVTYGAVDYLLKPVSVEELENAINRAKDQIVQEQPEAECFPGTGDEYGNKGKKDSDRYSTYYVTVHIHSMWKCK